MDLRTTLIFTLLAAVVTGLGMWGSRRRLPIGQVSLVPWNLLLFLGLVATCAGAAHLVALWTGQPMAPRRF